MKDFISMHLNTANFAPESVCSLTLVKFENQQVVNEIHRLIRPPGNFYSDEMTHLHGINSQTTETSPQFNEVLNELRPILLNQLIVVHDVFVQKKAFMRASKLYASELNLEKMNLNWNCTLRLSMEAGRKNCYFDDLIKNYQSNLGLGNRAYLIGLLYLELTQTHNHRLSA